MKLKLLSVVPGDWGGGGRENFTYAASQVSNFRETERLVLPPHEKNVGALEELSMTESCHT